MPAPHHSVFNVLDVKTLKEQKYEERHKSDF